MNNVVALRNSSLEPPIQHSNGRLLHDLNSPIMFKAWERPLFYKGKDGTEYGNTAHKALVRVVDDKPVVLNVVRDTYKVVQNDELFGAIDDGLAAGLSRSEIERAEIKDRIAYGGSQCFREYVFPDISYEGPQRDKIAFRIIVQNGFGTGSIKLFCGAIDFFCTNGLIRGEYSGTYARHTKGLQVSSFRDAVERSVSVFWKDKDFFLGLSGKRVLNDDAVHKWLSDKFGERLGSRIFHQYLSEVKTRQRNLWAVYSALTYYASHATGEFNVRNTGNDHTASTMMKREMDVLRATSDGSFMELAA